MNRWHWIQNNIQVSIWRLWVGMVIAMAGADVAMASSQESPPQPCSDDYDWIQFTNGEWLKGEIKELLYDTLTFESDELDTVELDWEDIYKVCSPHWNTYVFEGESGQQGQLAQSRVEGDEVILTTVTGEEHYHRDQLRSIIQGGKTGWDYWSGRWSLGITTRSGNTRQNDINGTFELQRRSPGKRTKFEYLSQYGTFEGEETTNNQQAYFRHDMFLNRQLYMVVPQVQFYRDRMQNIAYRWIPGAGLGCQLIDDGDIEWDLDAGYGYQYTRYSDVEVGNERSSDGSTLLIGTDYSFDLTDTIDFALTYKTTLGFSSQISDTHHALARFSLDIWKDLDFEVTLAWDRLEDPQPREDGSVPDRDDFRAVFGFGFEF